MGNRFILRKGESTLSDLKDGHAAMGLGVGNIYYVVKSSEAFATQFLFDRQGEYGDGSLIVHEDDGSGNGIQAALNVTVANRNDYVVVGPSQSDYDLTATLTMSKKAVHLICPGGLGNRVGSTNAARIHMTSDLPLMTISDSAIEIAGLYFKNFSNNNIMQLESSSFALNVHNNNFIWTATSTTGIPVVDNQITGTFDGGSWGTFEANWFANVAGGSATIAKLFRVHGNAKNFRIKYNEFTLSDAITVTQGIDNQAVGGTVDYNTFRGDGSTAVWTNCVNLITKATAIGNRFAVATGQAFSGGTADANFSDNRDGLAGGEVIVEA